jgi:hypothetical protein
MADKITKESVKKVSTPETKDTVVKEATPKIEMDKVANPVSTPSEVDREALKKELMKEVVGEMGAVEVTFMKTTIQDSKRFADLLNDSPKKLTMWELDEGEKRGALEEVTINGAVAQIPKGVSVLVPEQVASMIEGYKRAEQTAGEGVRNLSGGLGVKADRDEATRSALGL